VWKKALEEYEEPAMDLARREALEAYVAKRKEAIGSGSREQFCNAGNMASLRHGSSGRARATVWFGVKG
jgi:hypothetical protein